MAPSKQAKQPRAEQWETGLRRMIRSAHGRGWSVRSIRGRTQITVIWEDRTRSAVVTAIPWAGPEASKILALVDQLAGLIVQQHLPLAEAYQQLSGAGDGKTEEVVWPAVVDRFKESKLSSGAVKLSTWNMLYRPAMAMVVDAAARKPAPRNGRALLEAVAKLGGGAPGTEGRKKRLQIVAQLLRHATTRCGAPARWAPPPSIADLVGKKLTHREPTAPLHDHRLLRLLAGISDPRWRLAVGLMGCFGLRPIEAWHCRPEQGRLRVEYRKRTSAGAGKPRLVVGLDPARALGLSADLLSQLAERGAAALPSLPPSQRRAPSRALWDHLQGLPVWRELLEEAAAEGQQLVPYSLRHGFALRAHQHYELSVRVAASLMGHTTAVHLSAYGSWTDEATVEAAVAKAVARRALEAAAA